MKKVIALTVILCMAAALLASCGGSSVPKNPGNVYRVIVNDESGKGVQGVVVQFCSDIMCLVGETDANGIATFKDQEEGAYTVHVYSVPEGFAEDANEYEAPDKYGDVIITLKTAK